MNEYTRIQNTKDRAALLAQLVNADASAMQAAAAILDHDLATIDGDDPEDCTWFEIMAANYDQSRGELWKLIGRAEEEDPAAGD